MDASRFSNIEDIRADVTFDQMARELRGEEPRADPPSAPVKDDTPKSPGEYPDIPRHAVGEQFLSPGIPLGWWLAALNCGKPAALLSISIWHKAVMQGQNCVKVGSKRRQHAGNLARKTTKKYLEQLERAGLIVYIRGSKNPPKAPRVILLPCKPSQEPHYFDDGDEDE